MSKSKRQNLIRQILSNNKITDVEIIRGMYRRQEQDRSGFSAHQLFIFLGVNDEIEFSIRMSMLVKLAPKFRHDVIFTVVKKQERAILIADEQSAVYSKGSAFYKMDFNTEEITQLDQSKFY